MIYNSEDKMSVAGCGLVSKMGIYSARRRKVREMTDGNVTTFGRIERNRRKAKSALSDDATKKCDIIDGDAAVTLGDTDEIRMILSRALCHKGCIGFSWFAADYLATWWLIAYQTQRHSG